MIKENLIEVPFWIWRDGDQRRKIFILREEGGNFLYNDFYGKIFLIEKDSLKSLSSLKASLKERVKKD